MPVVARVIKEHEILFQTSTVEGSSKAVPTHSGPEEVKLTFSVKPGHIPGTGRVVLACPADGYGPLLSSLVVASARTKGVLLVDPTFSSVVECIHLG